MKNSKKLIWSLLVVFLFFATTAFVVTNSNGVDNNTKIEKVTKADCDKCGKADCYGKCENKCKKGKKRNKANASAKKGCSPHKCGGDCCKGSSAKKSCNGKSYIKADANTKKGN